MQLALRLCVCFTVLSYAAAQGVSCLDDSGNPVDWWSAYKLPNSAEYAFMTSASGSGWTQSPHDLRSTYGGVIYNTLEQIYNQQATTYVMYNDEPADSTTTMYNNGHTKGVMALDSTSGFYLVHSCPKWPPPLADGYSMSSNLYDFGQSMLCISASVSTLNQVAGNWAYTDPAVYDSALGQTSGIGSISGIISGSLGGSQQGSNVASISTLAGQSLTYMVKSSSWNQDLYMGLVAPTLQSGLQVDTWQNQPSRIPSQCTSNGASYTVLDVSSLSVLGTTWTENQDHSKWAVVTDGGNTACIGDINRDTTQFSRGGGTMCMANSALFSGFSGAVQGTFACGQSSTGQADFNTDAADTTDDQPFSISPVVLTVFSVAAAAVGVALVAVVIVIRRRNHAKAFMTSASIPMLSELHEV